MFSQNDEIKIIESTENNFVILSAQNISDVPQNVTLKLTTSKGLRDNKRPVTKKVGVGETVVLKKITKTRGPYQYSYSLSNSIAITEGKTIESVTSKGIDLSKGIIVFSKDDCPRCNYTLNYLSEKDIPFKLLDISEPGDNNQLMWKVLRENGVTKTITTPMIFVNGKLTHSHEDLKGFLKTL